MKKLLIISSFSVALFVCASVDAQTVPFVNLAYNAGQMAMGGTNATYNGAAAFYDESVAELSFFNWQPKAAGSMMFGLNAAVKAGGSLAILVDGKFNSMPEYQGYDGSGNPSGSIKSSQFYAALGAAYAIADNIALSVKAKFISDRLTDDAKGSAVCADISADYHIDGLDVALTASNIGSKLNYGTSSYGLPLLVKAGAVKNIGLGEKVALNLAADAGYIINGGSFAAGIGAELNLINMIDIRAGYHLGTNAEPSFASVGLGVSVSLLRLSAVFLIGPEAAGNTLGASLGLAF